jgi:hypothetical protein
MIRKIRVSTRADLFEQRKQEYLKAGYKIEDEQPVAVRGMCSFTVVFDGGIRRKRDVDLYHYSTTLKPTASLASRFPFATSP